jgi:IclR family pca regulon transcriptional regulator
MKQTDFVGGLAKGLKVIEAFQADKARLSIAEIATVTGLDRATARRCLLTLAELGYAHYDGKFFELTPRVLRLGSAYLSATPLPRLLQPHLDRLSEEVGQSASASVLDGTDIVYIARAALKRVMSINLMPGSRLPAWCVSMGRVILSDMPDAQARAFIEGCAREPFTPLTKVAVDDIVVAIAAARLDGYAINDQELELGLRSIAVPIVNERGRIVAAMNIGVAVAAMSRDAMIAHLLPAMRRTQAALKGVVR